MRQAPRSSIQAEQMCQHGLAGMGQRKLVGSWNRLCRFTSAIILFIGSEVAIWMHKHALDRINIPMMNRGTTPEKPRWLHSAIKWLILETPCLRRIQICPRRQEYK